MDFKNSIKIAALDIGFSAVGIAPATEIPELAHLASWISNGYNASMSWIRRNPHARCNPSSLLKGAKSVICVALGYGELDPHFRGDDTGVARFARGPDYHKVVREKLKLLWKQIKKPSGSAKFCVDTSSVLEKALAVRAGIGWQGKHSIIVRPENGSYFVLGEIITDLEIEPDQPIVNQCGECKKCIEACPTGAIIKPYIIDTRHCISYLTIEHKGRPGCQYGCDICQEACPYNIKFETRNTKLETNSKLK